MTHRTITDSRSVLAAAALVLAGALGTGCWGSSADDGASSSSTSNTIQRRVGGQQDSGAQPSTTQDDQSAPDNAAREGIDEIGAKVEGPTLANHIYRRAHAIARGKPVDTDVRIVEVDAPEDSAAAERRRREESRKAVDPELLDDMRKIDRRGKSIKEFNRMLENAPRPTSN